MAGAGSIASWAGGLSVVDTVLDLAFVEVRILAGLFLTAIGHGDVRRFVSGMVMFGLILMVLAHGDLAV
jgi:hypothetical protein